MTDEELAHWLKLREAADWTARSARLTHVIAGVVDGCNPLNVLDLGCGTGSNLRYLAERLPSPQHWLLVDRSDDLLSLVRTRTEAWASERGYDVRNRPGGFTIRSDRFLCHVTTRCQDLETLADEALFADRHLVTASALLDLVSDVWLETLVTQCVKTGAAALMALSYDGRATCDPPEPEDDRVRLLFNEHQHRDKGLGGPAAGPDAIDAVERAFTDAGFEVKSEPSAWTLAPAETDFQHLLIEGWASAATEQDPEAAPVIADWLRRRLAHVNEGRSRVTVGHRDLAAWKRS